jgi:hypothetical protein
MILVTAQMCKLLIKLGDDESFEKIISLIFLAIQNKITLYNKNPTEHNYFLIRNYIIFFMIITLNLKRYKSFITLVFRGKQNFLADLKQLILDKISKKQRKKELLSILSNLFLEEYKSLFFPEEPNEELEKLYFEEQPNFSSLDYNLFISYDKQTFKKMMDILFEFDLSYDNFFNNKKTIKDEDKPDYKLCIAQSIIRIAFSKEKSVYTDEKYFEYYFIKKVIDKDMEETKKKFGDEYKTLFRKEDLCDDIIKYMFFIFGNTMMIESFVKPVKKMLRNVGLDEDCPKRTEPGKGRDITVEEYDLLFEEISKKLIESIPHVIRILLKLLYNSIQSVFTIDKNNYNPLYTALIFNFIISPRVQMLYSINPLNCNYIRNLNRLLRNTCFNFKFSETDELSKFNESIEKNNKIIQEFINTKIISIKETDDEVKESLQNLFTEQYLIYPKFLFYVDSDLLLDSVKGGKGEVIYFKEMETSNNPQKK